MSQHVHTTFPIKINTPLGQVKFTQQYTYNAPENIPGPDPNQGHINNINGETVIVAPMPRDFIQDVTEHRADAPASTFDSGQEGRLVKDPASVLTPIVEPPTSSDSTAAIWARGHVFAGKIKF